MAYGTVKELVRELRGVGIVAKPWLNSGLYTPPADVNYKGELRVHTGGRPILVATDSAYRQAVIRPTEGRYAGEDFLIGMDETSNFQSRLPQQVSSVEEAHTVLRPEGVAPGSTRQGEWWFVPVEEDACACGRLWEEHPVRRARSLESGSSHSAEEVIEPHYGQKGDGQKGGMVYYGDIYARGIVTDDRQGRHKPVDLLSTWHRVVRNTERQMDKEPVRERPRHFD